MARNYYNEYDKKAAAWLRELIRCGRIPPGDVDERSICEVQPNDLAGYRQCHFFAGIGGWPLALKIAGVPDDFPLWTGSCPCQPFSCAGKQQGQADERHLWPAWFRLIKGRQRRQIPIFGEQVESAIRLHWLDGVSADMATENFTLWPVVLGAHSAGAPHIRQRLFWVAHPNGEQVDASDPRGFHAEPGLRGDTSNERLADAQGGRCGEQRGTNQPGSCGHADSGCANGGVGGVEVPGSQLPRGSISGPGQGFEEDTERTPNQFGRSSRVGIERMGEPDRSGFEPRRIAAEAARYGDTSDATGGPRLIKGRDGVGMPEGFWGQFDLLHFRDGKTRRIEPGLKPLVNGFPARVDLLRGYGNAINPYAAAEFIKAYFETKGQ